jgi:hypothetical protein
MTVYRVISGDNYVEYEFPDYASAMLKAKQLWMEFKPAQYRVEQVTIVYHTAIAELEIKEQG